MALARLAASLARPLTSSLPLLSACRTILTVNVHAPSAQSGNDLRTEIKRYEEIAASRINRMVQTEIRLGTLPPAPRRMKRYSRFTKPKEQRRLAGACTPEGVGRALLPGLLLDLPASHLGRVGFGRAVRFGRGGQWKSGGGGQPCSSVSGAPCVRSESGGVAPLQEEGGQLRLLDPVPQAEGPGVTDDAHPFRYDHVSL